MKRAHALIHQEKKEEEEDDDVAAVEMARRARGRCAELFEAARTPAAREAVAWLVQCVEPARERKAFVRGRWRPAPAPTSAWELYRLESGIVQRLAAAQAGAVPKPSNLLRQAQQRFRSRPACKRARWEQELAHRQLAAAVEHTKLMPLVVANRLQRDHASDEAVGAAGLSFEMHRLPARRFLHWHWRHGLARVEHPATVTARALCQASGGLPWASLDVAQKEVWFARKASLIHDSLPLLCAASDVDDSPPSPVASPIKRRKKPSFD